MSNVLSAIANREPRLLETRSARTPHSVRVAPEPLYERPLPRLEWAATGQGFEDAMWQAARDVEAGDSPAFAGCTIAIPLGADRGAEPELTEAAGAR